MAISLRQLQYFTALAETGSFGHAAEQCHVTQPALSQQVRELERSLGAQLVERLPRNLRLTRAGQEVLTRARRILGEVDDLEQAVRWHEGLAGRLHLGVIPTVAPYLLPLALARLRAQDVTLDIRVREAQTDVLLDALLRGRIDAAVVALPLGREGLTCEPLFPDIFLLAGSEGTLARWRDRPEALRPREIDPDHLLLLDEGHCLADQALEICGLSRRRQVDLGASSLSTLCGLVAAGFGVTLVPALAATTESAASPDLRLLPFADPAPRRDLVLVRRESSTDDGWMGNLAALLREAGIEALGSRAIAGDPSP